MQSTDKIINDELAKLLEDLDSGRKITFCLKKHLSQIKMLIDDGITVKKIHDATFEKHGISYEYFRKALRNVSASKNTYSTDNTNGINNIQKEKITEKQTNQEVINSWLQLQITSKTLIERLEDYGFSPSDIKKWNLNNENSVSKRLTELIVTNKVKKVRQNIQSDKQIVKTSNTAALSRVNQNEVNLKDDVIKKWENANITAENLIRMLEKNNISVDTALSWNCANEFQLSRKLTEYIISLKSKKKIDVIKDKKEQIEYSVDEWYEAFGFKLSQTYTPLAIETLQENGWTPDSYHKLKEKNNIFNNKILIHIISNIGKHKANSNEYQ